VFDFTTLYYNSFYTSFDVWNKLNND
jgi:hypothetical protein